MAFDPRKLTVRAGEAIQRAQELVEQKQQRFLRPLHLLKSLLEEPDGLMKPLLQKHIREIKKTGFDQKYNYI